MNVRPITLRATTAVFAAVLAAACSDTSAPGMQQVQVTMQQGSVAGAMAPAAGVPLATADAAPGAFSIDAIDSLLVTVDSIQFVSAAAMDDAEMDGGDQAAWQTLVFDDGITIDLLALPSEGDSPLLIASGVIEAGDYGQVRLFVSDPTIFFNQQLTLGKATFDVDQAYTVTVPSGAQSGLKTDLSFSVQTDMDVNLLFDPAATFQNVAITGNGKVMLAPVIKVHDVSEDGG